MTDAIGPNKDVTLLELLDRVIDHGVILSGDITIAVSDVDLVYLGLRLILTSIERAEDAGAIPSIRPNGAKP
jgi:gas vesicle structural protein